MLSKFHYSIDRELFEKVVNSNPALHKHLTWGKMWKLFFDELFPRSCRSLFLGLTLGGIILTTMLTWKLLFFSFDKIEIIYPEEQVFNQNSFEEGNIDNVAWEDSLNSVMVGRFWVKE